MLFVVVQSLLFAATLEEQIGGLSGPGGKGLPHTGW